MDPKENFDHSLRFTKLIFLFSGIQIDNYSTNRLLNFFITYCFFYLSQAWLYTDILGEIFFVVDAIKGAKNFNEISPMIPCITISMLGTIKAVPLYFQRNVIINILKELREIHPHVSDIETSDDVKVTEEQNITKDAINNFNKVIRLYLAMAVSVLLPFCFLPLMLMVYDHYTLGATEVKFPFSVMYFFDSTKRGVWPLVYVHQVISTIIVNFNIISADTLFYGISKFIQMHFRILSCRFEGLFSEQWDGSMKIDTERKLRELVVRHQLLIGLVKEMEKLYSFATLFNFVTSSFLICLSVFNVIMIKDLRAVSSFSGFFFMSLFQILTCCYGGDIIMRSSKDLSMAAYNSLWYLADENFKTTISIVHFRAQRPCKLTAANFADLNLSAFATVLRRSWSYLALLKTIYQ